MRRPNDGRATEQRQEVTIEVRLLLRPARHNGTVHVQGSVHGDGDAVAFSGWLDLLDALERVAERALDGNGDGDHG